LRRWRAQSSGKGPLNLRTNAVSLWPTPVSNPASRVGILVKAPPISISISRHLTISQSIHGEHQTIGRHSYPQPRANRIICQTVRTSSLSFSSLLTLELSTVLASRNTWDLEHHRSKWRIIPIHGFYFNFNMVLEAGYPGTKGFRKVVKVTVMVKKKEGLSDADFIEHYNNQHAQMAAPVLLKHKIMNYSLVGRFPF
jgi:hypothetical protein